MNIRVSGNNRITNVRNDLIHINVKVLENKIDPRFLAGLELLGIKTIFFKQLAVVAYNGRTLANYYKRHKIAEDEINKHIMFLIGSTTSKGERIKEELNLENKDKLITERPVLKNTLESELREYIGLRKDEKAGELDVDDCRDYKVYGKFRILSYPRRQRDTKYTLYFDFEKYKDRFREERDNWKIPIAEVASDSVENNFEGATNGVYILINLLDLFFIDDELATILLNNIVGWYLLTLRNLSREDIENAYLGRINQVVSGIIKSDSIQLLNNLKLEITQREGIIENYEEQIRHRMQEIEKIKNNLLKSQEELHKLENDIATNSFKDSELESQIKDIMQIDMIKNIEINQEEQALDLYTRMVYIQIGTLKYKIGEFKIQLKYLTKEQIKKGHRCCSPKFFNLTPGGKRKSYWGMECHHPHVDQGGLPCLGNGSDIKECLDNCDFYGATILSLAYLQSVNTSDPAGKYITSWDVVDEQNNIIYLGYKYSNPPKSLEVLTCQNCGVEAVAISGEIKEYTLEDDDNVYLCKDCFERKPHRCNSCNSFFTEIKPSGEVRKGVRKCNKCGKIYCSNYCFTQDSDSTTEERDYSLEHDICISCAREEVEEIKRKEKEKKEKLKKALQEIKQINKLSNNDLKQYLIHRRMKSLDANPFEDKREDQGDWCINCGDDWDEHYHCVYCGAIICYPNNTDKPVCEFCESLNDSETLDKMLIEEYQVERVVNGTASKEIKKQGVKLCSVCGLPMPKDREGDVCRFCEDVAELEKKIKKF